MLAQLAQRGYSAGKTVLVFMFPYYICRSRQNLLIAQEYSIFQVVSAIDMPMVVS